MPMSHTLAQGVKTIGEYHVQMVKVDEMVMAGMARYCMKGLPSVTPPGWDRSATFWLPPSQLDCEPAAGWTKPMFVSGPVTPETSARKFEGLNV